MRPPRPWKSRDTRGAVDLSGLRDTAVLVTGGGGGIGAAVAGRLVGLGARVVLTDVDAAALDRTVAALGAEQALGVVADVTDLDQMEDAVAQGVARFGGLDVVVANAGLASYGSVLAVDPAAFRRVIDVNLVGVFHTVRAALPSVAERHGYVLVVSSLAAFVAGPGMAAYAASKAGVEHLANVVRLEVAHLGVDVGSAHMSWIDTALVREMRTDLGGDGDPIERLPPPLNRTTDVDACADAFVEAIATRARRVYVPGWVGVIARTRQVFTSALGDRQTLRDARERVERGDAQVRALGRSTAERNVSTLRNRAR